MNHAQNYKSGLTLVEIIVVIAIIGLILILGLFISFDSYRRYIFRSERTTLVSVLSRARSRAMNNIFETPHGVCYDQSSKKYVIFRGNTYSPTNPTNESVSSNQSAIINPVPNSFLCSVGPGLIFSQLSGNSSTMDIIVTESNASSTISINPEGTINW